MKKIKIIQNLSGNEINDVASYLRKVSEVIENVGDTQSIVVYRGEPICYETACRPNIYRKGVLDTSDKFEMNLFDAMRQNKLSENDKYLYNAIDAQHGEFPSRLLDVSYNCLTALYFAVTPYYHLTETEYDDKDGMVYLIYVDEIYSPTAKNTNECYDAIVCKNYEWFSANSIFGKNHKFIDHIKLNNRIIAQQGAFILFQGHDVSDMPSYMLYGIKIPKESKKKIRRELKNLFGIHTGTIYPEITNLANEMSEKSKRINTIEFNLETEIEAILDKMQNELEYYEDYLIDVKYEGDSVELDSAVMLVEKVLQDYYKGFFELGIYINNKNDEGKYHEEYMRFKDNINQYTKKLEDFKKTIKDETQIEIDVESLMFKM